MQGPEGERSHGYWQFTDVQPGHSFEVVDGFAHDDGTRNEDMPSMRMVFTFEDSGQGSRLVTTTQFSTTEQWQELSAMGMEEGLSAAMGQIDDVLADLRSFAHGVPVEAKLIGDNQVRINRVIRGTVDQVWAAHHDAELMKQWLLGPDGWTMPVCELAKNVGDTYRNEWVDANGENRFGFTGELLEAQPPTREVTTEKMIGTDGPTTTNELTLTPIEDGTLLSLLITYPDAGTREMILGTGMTDGMEFSYQRLESELVAA